VRRGTRPAPLRRCDIRELRGVAFAGREHRRRGRQWRRPPLRRCRPDRGISQTIAEDLSAVAFATATTGFAAGKSGIVLRTVDAGATWSHGAQAQPRRLPRRRLRRRRASAWSSARTASIRRTTDGGSTWTTVRSDTITVVGLQAVKFVSPTQAVAFSADGNILRSVDGGATWTNRARSSPTRH
jgi:photosystem II stability/assembly factor-like uncharacterized protein